MPTQLNQNTTDLQSILDAVNALPEAGNTEIGASYNADGTQNLIIKDDGSVIEIPDPNPVLLWTNASPTSAFMAQTVTVPTGYDGYLVETKQNTTAAETAFYTFFLKTNAASRYYFTAQASRRTITPSSNSLVFGQGENAGVTNHNNTIPTRIWGVKFTL